MIDLTRPRAASRFVEAALDRHPEWLEQRLFDAQRAAGETTGLILAETAPLTDEPALMTALRRLRERELVRIGVRDVSGAAPLDETLGGCRSSPTPAARPPSARRPASCTRAMACRAIGWRAGAADCCWAWASSAAAS